MKSISKKDEGCIGIDLSLVSTGIAKYSGIGVVAATIKPKTKIGKGMGRIKFILDEIDSFICGRLRRNGCICIEDYAMRGKGKVFNIAELGGIVRLHLYSKGYSIYTIPPTTLKMFIADNGGASKSDVIAAVKKKFQYEPDNDNEADAIALAYAAYCRAGLDSIKIPYKQKIIDNLKQIT